MFICHVAIAYSCISTIDRALERMHVDAPFLEFYEKEYVRRDSSSDIIKSSDDG
jgi:hypothetical protein